MKRQVIGGTMYEVVTEEEYFNNPACIDNTANIAIINGDYTYPVRRGVALNDVGVYCRNKGFIRYVDPTTDSQKEKYSSDSIIDFDDAKNINDILQKTNVYEDMERQILISPDNAFIPKDDEGDSKMMWATKECMRLKSCDRNKYRSRFGTQFNNDMKVFDTNSITLDKAVRILGNFDVKMTVTLEDKDPNVANPMGKSISVVLTPEE